MYTKCYHHKVKFGNGGSTKTISTIANISLLRALVTYTPLLHHVHCDSVTAATIKTKIATAQPYIYLS